MTLSSFVYVGVLALSYGIALLIYRLTLHPLAKFPGPKLTAATKWWEFYVDVIKAEGGGFMYEVDRMHKVYGPIVRINPDEIHVKDPTWLDTIYSGPGPIRDKYPPSAHMSGVPQGLFGTIDHYIHRQRRSALKTFVSKRTVRTAQASIRCSVEDLCTWIKRYVNTNEPFDISLPYVAWSNDSVSTYLGDNSAGLLKDVERAQNWKKTLRTVVELTPIIKQVPSIMPLVLHLPAWLVRGVSIDLWRVLILHKGLQASAARARNANTEQGRKRDLGILDSVKPDAYQAILNSSLPLQEKEVNRVAQEVLTLLVGGSATTARVMTTLTFHLASEPAIVVRLREELNTIMPDPSVIPNLEQLESLKYLTAVLKESLRISQVVMSRLPLISPNQPLSYADWIIPPKTPVSMTPSSVLIDPTIFENSYEFQPERWLGSPSSQAYLEKYFVPFGRGTRICLGMNFAWAELFICTATIFRRFEFELSGDVNRQRDIDPTRDCFLGQPSRKSLGVRLTVREATS